MKLTQLRLTGFKSFIDPTDLLIEPGLTGVVGPNGCGKSNLLEALRWVMGENSYKSMRAGSMEDVIFSGTTSRPARNHAEVTLAIDNSDRTAPAAFNDTDTIEVSRRITRDTGSTYRINGKDVRARDVQLLFADASTGAHSPALVRQGQIGELINAKPTARRKILEEAAGITGLYTRRHEAELRLKAAETNMGRLDDVIAEKASHLNNLKRQARQAVRYRNLSGNIRQAEAIMLHQKWTEACQTVAQDEQLLAKYKTATAEATRIAANGATAQAEAASKLPPLREVEAQAAAALQRLNNERDNLEAEQTRAVSRAEELKNRLAQIAEDLTREQDNVKDATTVLESFTKEDARLKDQNTDQTALTEQTRTLMEQAASKLQAREQSLDEAARAAAGLTASRTSLQHTIAESTARIERLSRELTTLDQEQGTLERKITATANIQKHKRQAETAGQALTKAEQQLAAAEHTLKQARTQETRLREPWQQSERDAQALATEIETLARMLALANNELWPPLIDTLDVEAGFEAALGAALGDDLDIPADIAAPIHWDTLPPLHNPSPLPEAAEPLSNHVKAPPALARRLSQTGIVEDAQGKSLQSRLAPGQRLVSSNGALWRWDGFTAKAGAETTAARRLAGRNRLAELERQTKDHQHQAGQTREAYNQIRIEAEKAATAEEAARHSWRQAQKAHDQARTELTSAEKQTAHDSARLEALSQSRDRLTGEKSETGQALKTAEQQVQNLGAETVLQEKLSQWRETVTHARGDYSEARAAHDTIERETRTRNARLEQLAREKAGWGARIANAQKHSATLHSRQQETKAEHTRVQELPGHFAEKRVSLADHLDAAEKVRKAAADRLAEAETLSHDRDKADRNAQAALSESREARARAEATLEGAHGRQRDVKKLIREHMECAADKVLATVGIDKTDNLPALEQIEAKLERLKRDRERLGGVNLRAEEEAEELDQELNTMTTERADLEAAIAKLRQGISSLNREGRQRLLEAYDTVNSHFQRLFTHLFSGGRAHLELIESDDPLEAGLEIIAHPPGKKPQAMSLLSGGEQALTAMALIFAVFLTNPAPICVLDEVDAPLDDTNVDRFCTLLEEMTRTAANTRFLVITHHTLTMARVDRLFGVTMGERGVSQLVSVDLQTAEDLRQAS